MPSDPTVWYVAVDDYLCQSKAQNLIEPLTREDVEELLLETMSLIDAYVGDGWTPFTDGQEFIFPRCQDKDSSGNAEIPRPIALATRMIADAIITRRTNGVLPHEVASESNLGHSYTKKESPQAPFGFEVFPNESISLLAKYLRIGGELAIADDDLC